SGGLPCGNTGPVELMQPSAISPASHAFRGDSLGQVLADPPCKTSADPQRIRGSQKKLAARVRILCDPRLVCSCVSPVTGTNGKPRCSRRRRNQSPLTLIGGFHEALLHPRKLCARAADRGE